MEIKIMGRNSRINKIWASEKNVRDLANCNYMPHTQEGRQTAM